jgi:hypothetical protein
MTPTTASTLQRDVGAVVSAAAASHWDAAIDALDQLEADVASAQAAGGLSNELQRIPIPSPTPSPTTQPTPSTETNDNGGTGGGNDSQRGKSKDNGKGENGKGKNKGKKG